MKVACLLTDSIYALVVSDRGRTGRDVLDPGFVGMGEAIGGDDTTGVGSAGRCPSKLVLDSLELALGLEQVLALPVVPFLSRMS